MCLDGPLDFDSVVAFGMSPEKLRDVTQIVCRVVSAGGAMDEHGKP